MKYIVYYVFAALLSISQVTAARNPEPPHIPNPSLKLEEVAKLITKRLKLDKNSLTTIISIDWDRPRNFKPRFFDGTQWNFTHPDTWCWIVTLSSPCDGHERLYRQELAEKAPKDFSAVIQPPARSIQIIVVQDDGTVQLLSGTST
jgi:hypothetical protein